MADTLLESLEDTRSRERLEEESRVHGALAELRALLHRAAPRLAPSRGALCVARVDLAARPISWQRATVDTHALEAVATFERDGSLAFRVGLRLGDGTPEARTAFVRLGYSVPDHQVRVGGGRWLEPDLEVLLSALQEAFEREVASWYPRGRPAGGKKSKGSLG